jgi:hypothetical protein
MSLITLKEKNKHSITEKSFGLDILSYDMGDDKGPEWESIVVEKCGGALKFKSNGGYQTRNSSTIWCIKESDKLYKWHNFAPIKINTNDGYFKPGEYAYSTETSDYSNVVPDFNFRHWVEIGARDYTEMCKEIKVAGNSPFSVNKAGWIGNLLTHTNRNKLFEIGKTNTDIMDIYSTTMDGKPKFISMPDLVKTYSMLIDIEGHGYSGRLKYLLHSGRPLLLIERPHKEFFYEFMKPWVHYIPVDRDLGNLVKMVKWTQANYKRALEIGAAGQSFAQIYCTREAAFKQWNKIIDNITHK